MIEQLYNDIVKQIVPPEYKYRVRLNKNVVRFIIDRSIDVSHIDITDPIARILTEDCVDVRINRTIGKCSIIPYQSDHKNIVMGKISEYFVKFLKINMKQKNPVITNLYKWVAQHTGQCSIPIGSDEEYVMLFRYLNANINSANHEVHVKNGIAILNTLKTKYEAMGYRVEAKRGRRNRRNKW